MKKTIAILAGAFLIIMVCMVYLVKTGVSLRAQTLIRPSIAHVDLKNISQAVIWRLFPHLQTSHTVLWGVQPATPEVQHLLALMMSEYEKQFQKRPHLITDGTQATSEQIKNCEKPCWILLPTEGAHQLQPQSWGSQHLQPLNRKHISLTFVPFSTGVSIPNHCIEEKFLTFPCLKVLAVHEAERKIKTQKRHFFMKLYNDVDVFLFIQELGKPTATAG